MLPANLIEPGSFATGKQRLQGKIALKDLDERVWSHEYFADSATEVSYTLQGGCDRWQRLFLDLTVEGRFSLVCQRCMQPMPFEVSEHSHIVLFADEESLDEAMLSDEELEGMVPEKELNVHTLLEDQILMALPFSPRHDDCESDALDKINQDEPNPFAVLAGLKSGS